MKVKESYTMEEVFDTMQENMQIELFIAYQNAHGVVNHAGICKN